MSNPANLIPAAETSIATGSATITLNAPWTGGFGATPGGAVVGGSHSVLHRMNGVAVAVVPGSNLSPVQQAGPLALLPLAQRAMLNATVSNTWFASSLNGGITVNVPWSSAAAPWT